MFRLQEFYWDHDYDNMELKYIKTSLETWYYHGFNIMLNQFYIGYLSYFFHLSNIIYKIKENYKFDVGNYNKIATMY